MCKTTPGTNFFGASPATSAAWLRRAGPRMAALHPATPLPRLVEVVLEELVEAGESFTAYDVTMILRALCSAPGRILPHYDRHGAPGVQPEVHRQMAGYVLSGVYVEQMACPNGVDSARLYTPVMPRRRGGWRAAVARICGAGPSATPLPSGAWIVKNTSC